MSDEDIIKGLVELRSKMSSEHELITEVLKRFFELRRLASRGIVCDT